jgi:hypothetical protein
MVIMQGEAKDETCSLSIELFAPIGDFTPQTARLAAFNLTCPRLLVHAL